MRPHGESPTYAFRLGHLPGPARLAVALFVLLLGGAYASAQATLWLAEGHGSLPGPDAVLAKYHGTPTQSRLHGVLGADVAPTSPKAMWLFLEPSGDRVVIAQRRERVLGWVERGAPLEGWPDVRRVLHVEGTCLTCHGFGGERQDLPLETYEQVLAVATPGAGMPLGTLLTSAHNHAFGFALLALVLSLGTAATGLPTWLRVLLPLGAFGGAALDVGAWFLTRAYGAPWHLAVMAGGAAFGGACGLMALAVLREATLGRGPGQRAGGAVG